MEKRLCPECHKEMKIKKILDQVTVVMKCEHCHKRFKLTYDEVSFPKNINAFNWGSFFLWDLWGFWNGMPILSCFGLMLNLIPDTSYTLFSINMAISLYLGIRRNRLSWEKKEWSSTEAFETYQKKWSIIAVIVLCLCFIGGSLYGLFNLLNK